MKFHLLMFTSLQNPLVEFVSHTVVRSFASDQTIQQVSLPVNQDVFLAPASTVTLSVVRAEVVSPSELAGELGNTAAPVQLVIGDDVANPVVFFDQQSLSATVNDCKYTMQYILARMQLKALQWSLRRKDTFGFCPLFRGCPLVGGSNHYSKHYCNFNR